MKSDARETVENQSFDLNIFSESSSLGCFRHGPQVHMSVYRTSVNVVYRRMVVCTYCYDGITGVTGVLERYIFPTRQKKNPPKSS